MIDTVRALRAIHGAHVDQKSTLTKRARKRNIRPALH
jgi:hypothetical protein